MALCWVRSNLRLSLVLISKINRATDLGHTLILNSESLLPDSGSEDRVATLITTLGNLIENALEALGRNPVAKLA